MRRSCVVAAMAVTLVSGEPRLSAQKQGQIFVNLTAPDGKPVEGLQASEVAITEDGVDCKVLKVEPINWPTKLQVLVDNGRFNTNPVNPLRDGLKGFFEQIPDGVEMSLYVTAGNPRPVVKPTTDRQKLIDGIPLIAPDNGAGMFFDAFSEAGERIEKDKTPNFPIIMMVGSDFGQVRVLDRDYLKLQQTIVNHGVTAHVIVTTGSPGSSSGSSLGTQAELGLNLTKLTGGRYEGIATNTRLATLLPELGKRIAESVARQSHQYRVTYERPAKAKDQASIGASVRRDGTVRLSLRGNLP